MLMKILSKSPSQTEEMGEKLALQGTQDKFQQKQAIIIALEGELGAGKTVFVKGFAAALGVKKGIRSPTFNLMKRYPIKAIGHRPLAISYLYNLDCYRLNSGKELEALGFKEIVSDPRNIILIEWAERVKDALPRKYVKVHIDHVDETTRKLQIFNFQF